MNNGKPETIAEAVERLSRALSKLREEASREGIQYSEDGDQFEISKRTTMHHEEDEAAAQPSRQTTVGVL